MTTAAVYDLVVQTQGTQELTALQNQVQKFTSQMVTAQKTASTFARPANDLARSSAATSNAFKVAAFQVQDFVAMVQGGISPVKALALQLPQLVTGMGAFGVALGTAAGIAIPFAANLQIVQENLDRIIGYSTGLATVFAGKFILGLTAANGGFIAATRSALAFAVSLQGIKTAIIGTGLGALAVLIGEAVAAFIRLKEQTGSWGQAFVTVYQAAKDSIGQLVQAFMKIPEISSAVWKAFSGYATEAFAYILQGWASIQTRLAEFMDSMGASNLASQMRSVAEATTAYAQSMANGAAEAKKSWAEVGDIFGGIFTQTDAQRKVVNAFWGDYQGGLTATTAAQQDHAAAQKAVSDATASTANALESYRRGLEAARTPLQAVTADLAAAQENLRKFGQFLAPDEYQLALQQIDGLKAKLAELTAQSAESQNIWSSFQKTLGEAFGKVPDTLATGLTDAFMAFIDGTKSAEKAFKEFAVSFLKQVTQMVIQALLLKAITAGIGMAFGDGGAFSGGKLLPFANGGAFGGGREIKAFAAGGVVSSPVAFPMAGGRTGLMGEAGPEAIMPLTRRNGRLGVEGSPVNVKINNYTGAQVSAQRGADGSINIDVVEKELAARVARGGSPLSKGFETGYGLRRTGR
jgi:lambda family phage tail tape measure protein